MALWVVIMAENLKWLGHASFLITGEKTIYIDPWKLMENEPKADIILITHEHFDHCSPGDVVKISTDNTNLFMTPDCLSKFSSFPGKVVVVEPNKSYEADGIKINTVCAYNTNKDFHQQDSGWVGYIINVNGKKYYHAGDTDVIPEMKNLATENIDVAMLPVSGTYVMTPTEAAEAALIIKPKIVVPMHFGDIIGDSEDAKAFMEGCEKQGIKVKILEKV